MTLLLCLRENYRESFKRIPTRIAGTLAGVCFADFLVQDLSSPFVIYLCFAASGFLAFSYSYSLNRHSYLIFTFLVSVMVIFLMTSQQQELSSSRILATLTGGGCAFAALTGSLLFARIHLYCRQNKRSPSAEEITPRHRRG